MRELHIASVGPDGSHLVLVDDTGESFALRLDDRSYPMVRGLLDVTGRATPGDEPLAPREIQARIRTGSSVEDVAREAGVDSARVLAYARPVLAERAHMAERAGASPLGATTLTAAVVERLGRGGVDPGLAEWDAHVDESGSWIVTVAYRLDDGAHTARWSYAPASHAVAPLDADARWLAGEHADAGRRPDEPPPEASEPAPPPPPPRGVEPAASRPSRAGGRGGRRASVPSWDDILLGNRRPGAGGGQGQH